MTPPPTKGLLEHFTLSIEAWNNLLESERLEILRQWEVKNKTYSERIDLKDGYAILGRDIDGIKYVGVYANDSRKTVFIAQDDNNPEYPSYYEVVERLKGPQPYTTGLATAQDQWSFEDDTKFAQHLRRHEESLDDIYQDPMEKDDITIKRLAEIVEKARLGETYVLTEAEKRALKALQQIFPTGKIPPYSETHGKKLPSDPNPWSARARARTGPRCSPSIIFKTSHKPLLVGW